MHRGRLEPREPRWGLDRDSEGSWGCGRGDPGEQGARHGCDASRARSKELRGACAAGIINMRSRPLVRKATSDRRLVAKPPRVRRVDTSGTDEHCRPWAVRVHDLRACRQGPCLGSRLGAGGSRQPLSAGTRWSHGGRYHPLRGGLPSLRAGGGGTGRRCARPRAAPAPAPGLRPHSTRLDAGRRTPGEGGEAPSMEVTRSRPILCRACPGPGPADGPPGPSGGREPAGGSGGPGTPVGGALRSASGPHLAAGGAARGNGRVRPADRASVPAPRNALGARQVRLAGLGGPADVGPTEA